MRFHRRTKAKASRSGGKQARKRGRRGGLARPPLPRTRFEKISLELPMATMLINLTAISSPRPDTEARNPIFFGGGTARVSAGHRSRADQLAPNLRMASNKKANVISWLVQPNDEPRPTKCRSGPLLIN